MDLNIFGRRVELSLETREPLDQLAEEMALYPAPGPGTPAGYRLRVLDEVSLAGSRNPSLHIEGEDGFTVRAPTGDIRFMLDHGKLTEVQVAMRPDGGRTRAMIRRGRNIQYATPRESAGQTLHEMALVPSVMFDPTHFAVHSSAFQAEDGGVILVGGTGGVGKTSLALELCRHRGYRFLADDISVVSLQGTVRPNLAFPKIYRYNVEGDEALYRTIFEGRTLTDRLQWRARARLGADKARRRVSPERLYGGYSATGGPLRRYVILVRDEVGAIRFEELDPGRAARMSMAVIAAEFWHFTNHLHWHRYNRLGLRREPVLHPASVLARWEEEAEKTFSGREVVLCRVPRQMALPVLKREFSAWLGSS